MTERAEEGSVLWNPPQQTHTHLLPFDLLGCEVVTLHRVAPALAVASAREGRSLGAVPQRGQGHRSRLGAKTDGALQGKEERSAQKKKKKKRKNKRKRVNCRTTFAQAGILACRSFGGGMTYWDGLDAFESRSLCWRNDPCQAVGLGHRFDPFVRGLLKLNRQWQNIKTLKTWRDSLLRESLLLVSSTKKRGSKDSPQSPSCGCQSSLFHPPRHLPHPENMVQHVEGWFFFSFREKGEEAKKAGGRRRESKEEKQQRGWGSSRCTALVSWVTLSKRKEVETVSL